VRCQHDFLLAIIPPDELRCQGEVTPWSNDLFQANTERREDHMASDADRQAIVDVCVTYALALDRRDWTRLRTCFTDDAIANYAERSSSDGYEAIEMTCRAALEPLTASQHLLGNHLVVVNGDEADSSCYFQAQHVREGLAGGPLYTVAGRYDDRFVRTTSGWRIANRTLTVMWTSGNDAVLSPAASLAALWAQLESQSGMAPVAVPSLAEMRLMTDGLTGACTRVPGSELADEQLGGRRAVRVTAPGAAAAKTIVWLHGGGYVAGTVDGYTGYASRLSQAAGAPVTLPDYRLAPEHPFPAGLTDAAEAIAEAIDRVGAEHVVVGGDSAGGGLVVAALLLLRDEGRPLPAGVACVSPFADLSFQGESWNSPATRDVLIQRQATEAVASMYLGSAPAEQPLSSPVFAKLEALPPMLVLASDCEALRSDAERLVAAARQAGVTADLELWPDLMHDWLLFGDGLPHADDAFARLGRWARERWDIAG
jgi:acetyl esterase/lipase/ketosteroid isomerase-like protein